MRGLSDLVGHKPMLLAALMGFILLTFPLFGGRAPVVATWLIKITGGNHWMPSFYLAASAFIALIAVTRFKETFQKPLD